MSKHKLGLIIFLTVLIFFLGVIRKPEIMLVQQDDNFTDIVVKNFPLTQFGKMMWWKNNRAIIKENYNSPRPDKYGNYHIVIWDGNDGFRKMPVGSTFLSSGTHDLYCFSVPDSGESCIEKNIVMGIQNWRNGKTMIRIGNDEIIQSPQNE